jgi:hypothetical protein
MEESKQIEKASEKKTPSPKKKSVLKKLVECGCRIG